MSILGKILIGFVALEHCFILYMEMFAWNTIGKKVFGGVFPDQLFEQTRVMAANQGLYNGFLAAGLVWVLFVRDKEWRLKLAVFFLSCVIIAGVYGSYTLATKVFFTQALPAIIALVVTLFHDKKSV